MCLLNIIYFKKRKSLISRTDLAFMPHFLNPKIGLNPKNPKPSPANPEI
jgi:hypothetical protein